MDPREQLRQIREQKQELKLKLNDMSTSKASQPDDEHMKGLIERKKVLEDQRKARKEYKKMEAEYLQRRKQTEREKELARIQNEKRVVELEAAMKRVVFEGIKQKVKGFNSQQLMTRGFLSNGDSTDPTKPQENQDYKEAFEGYLLGKGPDKQRPKWNINNLNQQRLDIFEKKEELVMRQLVLKDLKEGEQEELNVLQMNRDELEEELFRRGINYEQFMHPVDKEEIINHIESIKEETHKRVEEKRLELGEDARQRQRAEQQRRKVRQEVKKMPLKDVLVVQRLLDDFIGQICDAYDRRHAQRNSQDRQEHAKRLEEDYQRVLERGMMEQLVNRMTKEIVEKIEKQMREEASEEIGNLHRLSHQKTQQCFKEALGDGDIIEKLAEYDKYNFNLTFTNEQQPVIGKAKQKQNYLNTLGQGNVFDAAQNTVPLISDVSLLDLEERYMEAVKAEFKNEIEWKDESSIFVYSGELMAVGRKAIKNVYSGRQIHTYTPFEGIKSASKLHRNWLIQSEEKVLLVTPWHQEEIGAPVGTRISNFSGVIKVAVFHPVLTLMGSPCSTFVGFEKGQLLKYNYNLNRTSAKQTNRSLYQPVIEPPRSGDEPAFPIEHRNYIPVQASDKVLEEPHIFRQFFEHHTEPVIFAGFFRVDQLITVDKGLKCAIWEYKKSRGEKSYEPAYAFEIRSPLEIYKQSDNPNHMDVYPLPESEYPPEEMYKKYLQTEAFLKLQLYNNPKKEIAYFKSPDWQEEQGEKTVWKVLYKQAKGTITKIVGSNYEVAEGRTSAEIAMIQGENLYVLCERDHVIRNDLKTIKLFIWNLNQRRLAKVAPQIDMYRDQKASSFTVLPKTLKGISLDMAIIVNSGRLLLFSLATGQLLMNVGAQAKKQYYFKNAVPAPDRKIIYAISGGGVAELGWDDSNGSGMKGKINKAIQDLKRKYL